MVTLSNNWAETSSGTPLRTGFCSTISYAALPRFVSTGSFSDLVTLPIVLAMYCPAVTQATLRLFALEMQPRLHTAP